MNMNSLESKYSLYLNIFMNTLRHPITYCYSLGGVGVRGFCPGLIPPWGVPLIDARAPRHAAFGRFAPFVRASLVHQKIIAAPQSVGGAQAAARSP